jgi:hypothetical protein
MGTVTNEASRLRALLVMLSVFAPLTAVATAVTPRNRMFTAAAMTTAFTVLIVIVLVMWSYRPAWFATRPGPLKGLELGERRLVIRAVRSGQALADPRLAHVASSFAGRVVRASWLMIGAAAISLAIRVWSLAGAQSALARVFGVLSAGLWLGCLAYGIRRLTRARRAAAANFEVLTQT